MYREEPRRYLDLSAEDYLVLEEIEGNMAAGSYGMNRCSCTSMISADTCLIEEHYLTSLYCYLPSMCCCKLLENRFDIITLLQTHNTLFSAELSSGNLGDHYTSNAESRVRFLTT